MGRGAMHAAAVLSTVCLAAGNGCSDHSAGGCEECTNSSNLGHTCCYCGVDRQCHNYGSSSNPCKCVTNCEAPTPAPPPTTGYCIGCKQVLKVIAEKGCEEAACVSFTGELSKMCHYIASSSKVCTEISKMIQNHVDLSIACAELGFCDVKDCVCGMCTPLTMEDHGRCLGAPNSCGHTLPDTPVPPPVTTGDEAGGWHVDSGVCVDGQCNTNASLGCCLTCF